MYQCPACTKYTISFGRSLKSWTVVCPNCGTTLKHKTGRLHTLYLVAPFIPAMVFAHYSKTGLINELVVLGICTVVSLATAARLTKLKVVQ